MFTARVPGILAALRIMSVPYYCITLLQPQAVLLYWATVSLIHHALQLILSTSAGARWARLPALLTRADLHSVPHQSSSEGKEVLVAGRDDASSSADMNHDEVESEAKSMNDSRYLHPGAVSSSSLSGQDSELLVFLGQRYSKQKQRDAATACYRLALQITDGDCKGAENGLKSLRLGIKQT
jgi:hypothetical protein